MTIVSDSDVALLRTHPHRTKLWLSIYKPQTRLACQVNDVSLSDTKGTRVITYNNVTAGNYLSVQSGMTMYVGLTAGDQYYGRIRVKSITSSTITVAENSDIRWYNDAYLTIVDFYEIQAVFPRITSTGTSTYWYKDYDIEYTNQNTLNGAFPCMGSHFAGFLDENNECKVFYSATGTVHVNSETMTYNWWFGGASTTGSSAYVPGYITYTTPGHYTTRLTVTGASGSVDYSYRHVSIYDKPDEGPNQPILKWQVDKLSTSRDAGGGVAEVTIFQNVPETDFRDGSLVVIFSEDWYGTTKKSIGGNQNNRSSIVFCGYIETGSIKYNYKQKSISFSITSPTGMMKASEGFSVSIEDNGDPIETYNAHKDLYPSPWIIVPDMNIKKAVWHYLKWHSTVLMTTDLVWLATDQLIQYYDADRTSLYDAVDTLMSSALMGRIISDMQGVVWAELDPHITVALGRYRSLFFIDNQDWIGDPSIELAMTSPVSYIEMGGIAYTGVSGSSTPYLSGAPGVSPGYRGTVERLQGLALTTQAHLNQINGRTYAYRNREYTQLTYNMAGNYRIFDVAPPDRYNLTVNAENNPRNKTIQLDVFADSIDYIYAPEKESFSVNVNFSHVPTWIEGETLTISPTAPVGGGGGGGGGGGFSVPPIKIPPIKIPSITIKGDPYLFVPAIGGSDGSDSPLVFAGGPYGLGSIESQIGISVHPGHNPVGTFGAGAFTVPIGARTVGITPIVLYVTAYDIEWYGEAVGLLGSSAYANLVTTLASGYTWTIPPSPGDLIRVYLEAITINTLSDNVTIAGWYVLFGY